jgi:hypothetical protein
MSSQVVVLPRKKSAAAAPQVSFLASAVTQRPAQTALQTASKRARVEAKTEAQTDGENGRLAIKNDLESMCLVMCVLCLLFGSDLLQFSRW